MSLRFLLVYLLAMSFITVRAQAAETCDLTAIEQLIFKGKYLDAENCAKEQLKGEISKALRAELLTFLGEALFNQSKDGQAYLDEALQIELSNGLDSLLIARTYLILGKNAANLGRFDEGLSYNDKSIVIRKQLLGPNHWILADNHNMLGYCHRFTSKYDSALADYEEAARIWEKYDGPLRTSMGPTYDGLGIVKRILSRPTESLDHLDHCLQLKKRLLNTDIHPSISNTLQHIGRNYFDLHQYNKALEIFTKVLEIRKQTLGEEHVNVGVAYGLIANCHDRMGNYDLAIDLKKRVISVFKRFLPNDYLLAPYTDLADAYRKNGQINEYLETLAKSEEVINASPRFGGQYLVNNYLLKASHFHSIGDEQKRLETLIRTQKLVEKSLKSALSQQSKTDFHLGQYYLDHEEFATAKTYFDKALHRKAGLYGPESPVLHQNYIALGDLHFQQHQYVKAKDYYQKSLELELIDKGTPLDSIPDVSDVLVPLESLISLSKIAASLYATYRQDTSQVHVALKASTYYLSSLNYLHFLRNSFYSDEAKIRISSLFSEVSGEALDLYYELHQKNGDQLWLKNAFWISEMRRSQVLVEAINEGVLKSLAKVPDSLLEQEMACYGELAYLRQKLRLTNLEEQNRNELEKRLFQKGRELDQLKSQIRLYFPDYHRLKYEISSLTVLDIQQALRDEEELLVFSVTDSNIYRFLISKERSVFDQVKKPRNWTTLLEDHHRSTTDYRFIVNRAQEADLIYRTTALTLHELLIPQLSPGKTRKTLTIVPHDSLHNINFSILLAEEVDQPLNFRSYPYLLRTRNIRYAPSVSTLIAYPDQPKENLQEGYIGFAASAQGSYSDGARLAIPGANEEIAKVGDLFGGKTLQGSEATEENFRKEASKYNVIHLAMHGTVDQNAPLNSQLHFAEKADSLNDGTLHLDEVYGIPMNAELAVLSACDTGDGQLSSGEGLMSIARAFNYAGCRSVLMSQWKVADEEGTQLIVDFFRALKHGQSKSSSLRTAQLNYLDEMEDNMRTHPFFWAGFRLIGDDLELHDQNDTWKEWLIIFTFLMLVIGILFTRRKKT